MYNDPGGQAEKVVKLSHPLGVTLGQVVIDRHYVNTAPCKGIQVDRKRGDKCLSFTCLHLCDLALVKHHAAD